MAESWLTVVITVCVVALAIPLVLVVLAAAGVDRGQLRRGDAPSAETAGVRAERTSMGSLVRGFGYVSAPLAPARQHDSVAGRLSRAYLRVDRVDPYLAPRRVGEALLSAGLVRDSGPENSEENSAAPATPDASPSDPTRWPPLPIWDPSADNQRVPDPETDEPRDPRKARP